MSDKTILEQLEEHLRREVENEFVEIKQKMLRTFFAWSGPVGEGPKEREVCRVIHEGLKTVEGHYMQKVLDNKRREFFHQFDAMRLILCEALKEKED